MELGFDFERAWRETCDRSPLDDKLRRVFFRDIRSAESLDEFLIRVRSQVDRNWSFVFTQILWSLSVGASLGPRLREISADEAARISSRWQHESKAIGLLLLLPLGLICFPSAIFLSFGPHFRGLL